MRKQLYKTKQKNYRHIKKLNKCYLNKHKLRKNKKLATDEIDLVSKITKKHMSPGLHHLVMSQIRLSQYKAKGRRYTDNDKLFALKIYHRSAATYRLLSKTLQLPSKSTLSDWLSSSNSGPGFDENAMSAIKCRVQGMADVDKTCVLLLDEMSLKSNLQYSSVRDEIVGLEDFGNGDRTNNVATSVLVAMLRGIRRKWKQPFVFFFTHTSCKAAKLKEILLKCLDKAKDIGLNVVGVVSDQGPNLSQLSTLLEIKVDKPYFEHCGSKVFYLFDTPHLMKSIRNNLRKHDFHFSGKVAKWKHFEQFYEIDSQQKFRLAPKITKMHVYLPAFSSMRVKYATQAMSLTCAAGLDTHVKCDPPVLPAEASSLAELFRIMNNVFDGMNSSVKNSKSQFQRALYANSNNIEQFKEMIKWFGNLKVVNNKGKDGTSQIKCIKGWH
jgi:hypothetical protein